MLEYAGLNDHHPDRLQHQLDQAKLAAEGRWEELEELQDILLGGRES